VFQVESGFDNSNGGSGQGGRLFGRQATLGLAGDAWGTFELGRQTNMASKYLGPIDPFGAGFGQANLGHGISAANTVRYDNMALYRTPSFNGFQFGIGYSFATDAGTGVAFRTSNNVRALTAGLRYANGPLNVAVTYDQLRDRHNLNRDAKPRVYGIGVSYDFEVVKLAAAYARTTDGWFQGQAATGLGNGYNINGNQYADDFKANSYMLGVTVPVGSGAIVSSWQHVNPNNANLTGGEESLNVASVGYTYDFSKRTNLYAFVSYAKDYAFIDGAKSTATGIGLRHRF